MAKSGAALARLAAKKARHEATPHYQRAMAKRAAARQELEDAGFDTTHVKHPVTLLQGAQKHIRRGMAFGNLAGLKAGRATLGYERPTGAVEKHELGQLDTADTNPEGLVDERAWESPTKGALSRYAQSRFDPVTGDIKGLSDAETASIRGAGHEAIGSGASDAYRQEGEREAAAGIDPRSGVAAQRAMQIERATQQANAGLERDITTENLSRKAQLEGVTGQEAGLEERGREGNVSQNLRRLADVETGAGQAANRRENEYQFDVTLTEAQRQARAALAAQKRAAKEGKPSGVEKASKLIGGIFGGALGGVAGGAAGGGAGGLGG